MQGATMKFKEGTYSCLPQVASPRFRESYTLPHLQLHLFESASVSKFQKNISSARWEIKHTEFKKQ